MNTINPISARPHDTGGDTETKTGAALPDSQGLNNMFLQLLVAQLKNQSPLNPMDPTQFVGQLAQFSELSAVTQINDLLQKAFPASSGSGSSGSGSPSKSHPGEATNAAAAIDSSLSTAVAKLRSAIAGSSAPLPNTNHLIQGVF